MPRRIERINNILKREISQIILREIDFDNAFVTITGVRTTPNLTQSEILITVMPDKEEARVLQTLERNIYDIQKSINRRLRIKPVPKITFRIDEGMKNLYKIDKISTEM